MISLSLFAEKESEVELVLIYAVLNASWTPIYDIRVNTQDSEMPVTLVYKAAIRQNTAEDWENVPLTLETATPTFQVGIPTLGFWTLSVFRSPPPSPIRSLTYYAPPRIVPRRARRKARRSSSSSSATSDNESYPVVTPVCPSLPPPMNVLVTSISSKGNVSATFTIPRNITVPSDNANHNVTVTQLDLDATMSWVAVPKLDTKTRLSAKIKNASEYTLLSGIGSIYVDGSFIAKSDIPAVSPGESFNCALGLDPAIRITYHPVSKKLSKTGFYTKHHVYSYSQRISVYNTKSIPIKDLRIMDQIPVSADETITVKLLTPSLLTVRSRSVGSVKDEKKTEQPAIHSKVPVSQDIVAGWGHDIEDTSTTEDGTTVAGQDGKLSWVCEMPPQGSVNLLLQWEVTSPASTSVYNL
ncbi:hypothetical protein M378DRAFT_181749 [Amanita muscaria Koide BX008]|uniref:DUF4139 domain-containing protein n=1 Tax=Amanita muscaria (strain Koide BX008) TaxID=946122 RepID=A0A0C2WK92_AMAMK|nr:hypothetical protein M378DRAFT_181749 [Amanita muscaria Koide BX008]